jgi:hypothetical protein
MTYRVAASVLEQMFPVDAGKSHETLRTHTLKLGEQLQDRAVIAPTTAATAIAISVDSTFIRSCEDGERHLEVRVGNVETETGGRQVFGAVAKADTDIVELIRRNLTAVGQTDDTKLTGFTDGCPALRSILAAAGVAQPPILDWFHIAMRLQHLKQIAGGLSTDDAARAAAKTVIVEEVERLRWRLWNGKAKGRPNQHRPYPQSDACFSRGAGESKIRCAITQALDRLGQVGRLSLRSEQMAGQLRRTSSRRLARRDGAHRSDGEFPGEPSDEQIPADAMDPARRRPAAAGPLRRLQWNARLRVRPAV